MFEGLEIDQYIWSVLQNKQTSEFDEITIDQNAKIKPCLPTVIKVRCFLTKFQFFVYTDFNYFFGNECNLFFLVSVRE